MTSTGRVPSVDGCVPSRELTFARRGNKCHGRKLWESPAPIDREVAKLIRQIDQMTPERSGKIVNFTTGQIDPF